jgi:dephospho-CoA kinase
MITFPDCIIIGVTGQMGSGKSTVSGLFKEWGSQLIDADLVAHEFLEKPEVLSSLENQFDCKLIDLPAKIRRLKLSAIVFKNRDSLDSFYEIIKIPLIAELEKKNRKA